MSIASPLSLATVVAHRVSKSRGLAPILVDVDLTVGPNHRIGVIGPNGVGKTTLLRILAGQENLDAGRVVLSPPAATVGYLAQEPDVVAGESLRDLLLRRTGVGDAERRLEEAAAALGDGESVAGTGGAADDTYSLALERYLALGGPT